jgi:hypothetical protein
LSPPAGALAEPTAAATGEPEVRLSGVIAAPDGSSVLRAQLTGAAGDGDALGHRLARTLLQQGAAALLDRCLLVTAKNGGNCSLREMPCRLPNSWSCLRSSCSGRTRDASSAASE